MSNNLYAYAYICINDCFTHQNVRLLFIGMFTILVNVIVIQKVEYIKRPNH